MSSQPESQKIGDFTDATKGHTGGVENGLSLPAVNSVSGINEAVGQINRMQTAQVPEGVLPALQTSEQADEMELVDHERAMAEYRANRLKNDPGNGRGPANEEIRQARRAEQK